MRKLRNILSSPITPAITALICVLLIVSRDDSVKQVMAQVGKKIHELTAATSLAESDILYAVISPDTAAADRKITLENLRASLAPIDVASFATSGSGTSIDPWVGWDTAIAWAQDGLYRFRNGWFAYSTSPNFLKPGIHLVGEAGTYLKHTGRGNAFVMDSNQPGVLWIQNVKVENIDLIGNYYTGAGTASVTSGTNTVTGSGTSFTTQVVAGDTITFRQGTSNAESRIVSVVTDNTHLTTTANFTANASALTYTVGTTTNGFYLSGVRNGVFDHISVHDCGGNAFYSAWCVTNALRNFRCTYHEPIQNTQFNVRAQDGINLDVGTTNWEIMNVVLEGLQSSGVHFKNTFGNVFYGGTSEGNPGKGVLVDATGGNNTLIQFDCESNGDKDFDINSPDMVLVNCSSSSNVASSSNFNTGRFTLSGGIYQNPTFPAGSVGSCTNVTFKGTITQDAASSTQVFNCSNAASSLINDLPNLGPQSYPNSVALPPGGFGSGNFDVDANRFLYFDVFGPQGNFTLLNPTSTFPFRNGTRITFRIRQWSSPGNAVASWGDKYLGPGGTIPANTLTVNKTDYYTFIYSSADDKWHLISYSLNL